MKTSIIIPARDRPTALMFTLESLWSSTRGLDLETIVVIDNDPRLFDLLEKESRITQLVYNDERLGSIASWNKGLALATGDILTPGADDIFFEPNWLAYALEAHQNELDGYGVIGVNGRVHPIEVLSGGYLFDRQFCKDHLGGVMFCPHYRGLFADKEIDIRAKSTGHWRSCPQAVTKHMHSCEGRRPYDKNDKYRDSYWKKDEAVFNRRLAAGFPDDYEPVI